MALRNDPLSASYDTPESPELASLAREINPYSRDKILYIEPYDSLRAIKVIRYNYLLDGSGARCPPVLSVLLCAYRPLGGMVRKGGHGEPRGRLENYMLEVPVANALCQGSPWIPQVA